MDGSAPSGSGRLVGVGLFTAPEAGRLLETTSQTVRRWLLGYSASGKEYQPLWTPQIGTIEDEFFLGFRDLMELRVAIGFRRNGVSMQQIRRAILLARDVIEENYPLSSQRFKTDGKSIFLEVLAEDGSERIIDLNKGQFVFKEVMKASFKDVEFEGPTPVRWWVNSRKGGVVVDPARQFGQPIVERTGVPTKVLANAYRIEGDAERAAEAWSVSPKDVRDALAFENGPLALAA